MTWTPPRTWSPFEIPTDEGDLGLNTYLRDNLEVQGAHVNQRSQAVLIGVGEHELADTQLPDHGAYWKVDSGQPAWITSASPALLATTRYLPSSPSAVTAASTPGLGDVDAANLNVVFTAPVSGMVRIVLSAQANFNTGNAFWGLREGTTDRASVQIHAGTETSGQRYLSMPIILSLAAGAHTLKWGHRASTVNGLSTRYGGTAATTAANYGPALMEVWAL